MDDVAEVYGISPARLKQLKSMVDGLVSRGRKKAVAVRNAGVRLRASKNTRHAHNAKRAAERK